MLNFLIAHGAEGSPQENWFPWLKKELNGRGHVIVPQFPTPDGQNLPAWLSVAEKTLVGSDPAHTVLIGHSTGSLLALRMAEQTKIPFRAMFAICPFAESIGIPKYDYLNHTFLEKPFDWLRVKQGAQKRVCFAGDNDPYVHLNLSRKVAEACEASLIVIPNGGHLNQSTGYVEFPLLLNTVLREIE